MALALGYLRASLGWLLWPGLGLSVGHNGSAEAGLSAGPAIALSLL